MINTDNRNRPKVGLLALSSRRFSQLGEGTADGTYYERIERETAEISDALSARMDVIRTVEVTDHASLAVACTAFEEEQVDCIIAFFHSWAEDNIWVRFLRDHAKDIPLIYYHPAKETISYENCDDENDFIQFLANGGLVGSLIGSGSIRRMGRKAKVISGSIQLAADRIASYALACKLKRELSHAVFGIMPHHNEIMWGTYIDPYGLFSFGPELRFISYQELYEEGERVSQEEISAWKEEIDASIERYGEIEESKFDASLRYSIAISRIMESYGLDALTLNDVSKRIFEEIGLRPGFYHPSINERGSILCPEGDLGIALAEFILKRVSGRQVNIIEPFYIDESRDLFCAGHAGPNDYSESIGTDYVKNAVDARFAKSGYRYAGAPFAWLRIPPGTMTMLHMSQLDGKVKMVVSLIESIDGPHRINGYSHGEFKPIGKDVNVFFEEIMSVGTTQHVAVVPGDCRDVLQSFAELSELEYHLI